MFGLFKKKEEKKVEPVRSADSAMARFGARFERDEIKILAVTGSGSFSRCDDIKNEDCSKKAHRFRVHQRRQL